MKTKFKFLMAAAVLAVGFSSCSSDDDGNGPVKGDATTLKISLPIASTYGPEEDGREAESKFTSVDIYIFNGTSLENHHTVPAGDFELQSGKWVMQTPLAATTGVKNIYVGLNLPAASKAAIEAGVSSVVTPTAADVSGDGAFAMFSANTPNNVTFDVQAEADKNKFEISVERWAAKVTARKANSLVTDVASIGAIFSDLRFCLGHVNTKMYPFQKIAASNLVEDPNYAVFMSGGGANYDSKDFVNEFGTNAAITATAYVELDAETTDMANRKNKFALENTSRDHKKGEVTYASVRATFQPKKLATYTTAAGLVQTENSTALTGEVTAVFTSGGNLFFLNKTQATDYAKEVMNITDPAVLANTVMTYKDGFCYYYVWLDSKTAASGTHGVLRNNYFDTKITQINSLGYPDPDPTDPDTPTPSDTKLTVEVTIKPWTWVSSDNTLGRD